MKTSKLILQTFIYNKSKAMLFLRWTFLKKTKKLQHFKRLLFISQDKVNIIKIQNQLLKLKFLKSKRIKKNNLEPNFQKLSQIEISLSNEKIVEQLWSITKTLKNKYQTFNKKNKHSLIILPKLKEQPRERSFIKLIIIKYHINK